MKILLVGTELSIWTEGRTARQTDIHDEASSPISKFCQRAYEDRVGPKFTDNERHCIKYYSINDLIT